MKIYFALKTFKRWVSQEGHRFFYRPFIHIIRKEYFILRFTGITPKISCIITKSGTVAIWAAHRKENWDILSEFDIYEQRNEYGQYFCQLCEPPKIFTSRKELWVKHSFEPLLKWCNEHLQRSRMLLFLGREGNYTYADIKRYEELSKMKAAEDFVSACPVVLRDASILGNEQ